MAEDDDSSGIVGRIRTNTSVLDRKSKEHADDKASDETEPTVDTSNLFGGAGGGGSGVEGEQVDFGTLNEIMDKTEKGTSIWEFLKVNWYWIFTVVFSVGLVLFSFRENLVTHGYALWYSGVLLMLPFMIVVHLVSKKKALQAQDTYPVWADINSPRSYNFYTVRDSKDTMAIMPFVTDEENNVYRPDNPFDKRKPLTIRIDKDCLSRFERGGIRGVVSLGDIELDRTGKATFRVTHDPAYVPSPEMYQKNFELKMLKMQLEMEKKVSVSRREMIQKIAKADTGEWIKFVVGLSKDLLSVSKLMLRREEGDKVQSVRLVEALSEKGYIPDDKEDEALDTIKSMDELEV